ncbi:hypothetical protein FA13DRAFT_1796475 [Coprinellus micaceus]|uniref:Uncharacterized protein n=1 Tax=Coprinellus micaceus TaxID=71717 RepID=A0A4Y7SUT9_COPMI|nr:hypothetical protein FA13DRAFT_1796475 [Coprinellus micaceus]
MSSSSHGASGSTSTTKTSTDPPVPPARFPREYAIAAEELLGIIPSNVEDNPLLVQIKAQEIADAVQSLETDADRYLEESLDTMDPIPPSGTGSSFQPCPEVARLLNFDAERTPEAGSSSDASLPAPLSSHVAPPVPTVPEGEEVYGMHRIAMYKLYHGSVRHRRYLSEDLISSLMRMLQDERASGGPLPPLDTSLLNIHTLDQLITEDHTTAILEHAGYAVAFGFGRGVGDCQVLVEVILSKDAKIKELVRQALQFLGTVFRDTSLNGPLSRQNIDEVLSSLLARRVVYPTAIQVFKRLNSVVWKLIDWYINVALKNRDWFKNTGLGIDHMFMADIRTGAGRALMHLHLFLLNHPDASLEYNSVYTSAGYLPEPELAYLAAKNSNEANEEAEPDPASAIVDSQRKYLPSTSTSASTCAAATVPSASTLAPQLGQKEAMEVDEAPCTQGGSDSVPQSKILRPLKRRRLESDSESDSESASDSRSLGAQHEDAPAVVYEGLWRRRQARVQAGNFHSPILEVETDVFVDCIVIEFGEGGLVTLEKEQRDIKAGAVGDKMWRFLQMPVSIGNLVIRCLVVRGHKLESVEDVVETEGASAFFHSTFAQTRKTLRSWADPTGPCFYEYVHWRRNVLRSIRKRLYGDNLDIIELEESIRHTRLFDEGLTKEEVQTAAAAHQTMKSLFETVGFDAFDDYPHTERELSHSELVDSSLTSRYSRLMKKLPAVLPANTPYL